MDTSLISIGLQVSLYGLGGVFTVLILFYILVKIMMALSDRLAPGEDQ